MSQPRALQAFAKLPNPTGTPKPSFLLRAADQQPTSSHVPLTPTVHHCSGLLQELLSTQCTCWHLVTASPEERAKASVPAGAKAKRGQGHRGEGNMDLAFRAGKAEFRAHRFHIK